MKNNRIMISLICLVVLGVCIHYYKLIPLSVSFGRNVKPVPSVYRNILPPGLYFVSIDKPVRLPDGMKVFSSNTEAVQKYCGGMFGSGFEHEGEREDVKKKQCEKGSIKTTILDDYQIKYECLECGKIWITDLNESK